MDTKRKPLPGIRQCQCGSRSFFNGACAICGPGTGAAKEGNGLEWLGKEYADLYEKPVALAAAGAA